MGDGGRKKLTRTNVHVNKDARAYALAEENEQKKWGREKRERSAPSAADKNVSVVIRSSPSPPGSALITRDTDANENLRMPKVYGNYDVRG